MNVQGNPTSTVKTGSKPDVTSNEPSGAKAGVKAVVKGNGFVFPLACLTAFAFVFISEGSYWQSVKTLDELSVMAQAHTAIRGLQQGLLNAETGQRGYLLTHQKDYLAPYDKSVQDIDASLKFLSHYAQDKPALAKVVDEVETMARTKLSEIDLTLSLDKEGKGKTAMEIVMSGIGQTEMNSIRLISDELLAIEKSRVSESRADIDRTLLLSRAAIAVWSALSLLALYLYLRQSFVVRQQQLELQRIVQLERDRLEVEVIERTEELTKLTQYLQTAREDERNRLARNLHDDLGALLTSAKLDAARIKSRVSAKAPEALDLLAHLVDTLNGGIALGRNIIENLRPSALRNLGLLPTLEILAKEFTDLSGLPVHCTLEPVQLNESAELMVYRLVQEAMTNITKYANATQVWVSLAFKQGQIEVSVRDDGVGFDTRVRPHSAYGLMGMRFRVEAEGGVLTLTSRAGEGTLIQARLPESFPVATETPL